MDLLHRDSSECAKSELDLFYLPPTQVSIEKSQWVEHRPLASIGENSNVIKFMVNGTGEEYVDLSETYLHLNFQVFNKDGTPLVAVVEQIIAYGRRIVQIMIQATDLAQLLYRGHPSRKKRGPRKISIWPPFSKMAAMGYPEILFFTLNGQQMVEKDNYEIDFMF